MSNSVIIAYAGCTPAQVKKLKLCEDLLQTVCCKNKFIEWQGAQADLLIANFSDAYGKKVASVAQRKNIPLMLFIDPNQDTSAFKNASFIPNELPAAIMHKHIEREINKICTKPQAPTSDEEKNAFKHLDNLLSKLHAIKGLSSFGFGKHHVFFDSAKGVCFVINRSDLTVVLDAIRQKKEIWVKPHDPNAELSSKKMHLSIESFFFHALIKIPNHEFMKDKTVKLSSWPNINSSHYSGALAALCAQLIAKPIPTKALYESHPKNVVSSMLYATKASKLLSVNETNGTDMITTTLNNQTKKRGLIGALSKWLGA